MFPISTVKGVNFQSGLMMAEAMRFAVEHVNNRSDLLHGYKLKISKIYDYNSISDIRGGVLKTFLEDTPFLIGPHTSEATYETSILTGTFSQPSISYAATFSDFDTTCDLSQFMLRSVSSDTFRIQVALDLLKKLAWNYVGVISSYGYNGERDARRFISRLNAYDICLGKDFDLSKKPNNDEYIKVIKAISLKPRIKAVVLFTTHKDSAALLDAIMKLGLSKRFHLIFFYGGTNFMEVVKNREHAAAGSLSIDIKSYEIPEFREWFLSRNLANSRKRYFRVFWETLFQCSIAKNSAKYNRTCSNRDFIKVGKGYYPNTNVQSVVDAVYAIAYALKALIEFYCNSDDMKSRSQSKCFINAKNRNVYSRPVYSNLKEMAFKDGTLNISTPWNRAGKSTVQYEITSFGKVNKTFQNIAVGRWEIARSNLSLRASDVLKKASPNLVLNTRMVLWDTDSKEAPNAVCSKRCPVRHVRKRDINSQKYKCCWQCELCPPNSIALNDTCVQCASTERVDDASLHCIPLPEQYIQITASFEAIIFIFFSVAGLLLVTLVGSIFVHFNGTRIVRAAGRDLCYMMLMGVALTFACPFAYLNKPSVTSCIFRGTLPGVAFLACYAPLFLKTNRIYRIFLSAKSSVSRPILISPQSQLLILSGIICIQVLLAGVWFVSKLPEPEKVISADKTYITVHCKGDASPILMLLNLALSVVFMICCTFLAFKTRNFPKNYNEAKYIGITMYITCVCWAVFLPAYFVTPSLNTFLKEYLMCSICIIIGMVTLFGLFGQKVQILLFPSKADLNENKSQMLSSISQARSFSQEDITMNGTDLTGPDTENGVIRIKSKEAPEKPGEGW